MSRTRDALSLLGTALLLVWLLAVAGAFSPPGAVAWALFGAGLGVLAVRRALGGRAGQRRL